MKKLIALTLSIVVILCSVTIAFTASVSIGDIDHNGKVDVIDATTIQRGIAKIISLDEQAVRYADVDGDGKVSVMDCTSIQQFVAKIIPTFPCENTGSETAQTETVDYTTSSSLKPTPTQSPDYTPAPTTAPQTEPETISSEQRCRELELEILRLVNIEREKEGLEPVAFAYDYHECAKLRAVECRTPETFSHTRPDGRDWHTVFDDLADKNFWSAGENIALYFQTAQEVVDKWMGSPGHRANILHPDFNLLTVGVYEVPEYEGYYSGVQLFIATWDRYHD